jgi:hypothetical protein
MKPKQVAVGSVDVGASLRTSDAPTTRPEVLSRLAQAHNTKEAEDWAQVYSTITRADAELLKAQAEAGEARARTRHELIRLSYGIWRDVVFLLGGVVVLALGYPLPALFVIGIQVAKTTTGLWRIPPKKNRKDKGEKTDDERD